MLCEGIRQVRRKFWLGEGGHKFVTTREIGCRTLFFGFNRESRGCWLAGDVPLPEGVLIRFIALAE